MQTTITVNNIKLAYWVGKQTNWVQLNSFINWCNVNSGSPKSPAPQTSSIIYNLAVQLIAKLTPPQHVFVLNQIMQFANSMAAQTSNPATSMLNVVADLPQLFINCLALAQGSTAKQITQAVKINVATYF